MKRSAGVLASALFAVVVGHAQAQQYPQRPVNLVVPFPPGGATDAFARIVAERMTKVLGQQIVVINRDGASGIVGTDSVARAAPDGYTLAWATSSGLAIMHALGRKMPYDSQRDFAPISLTAKLAYVLVVHPSLPVKTIKELVAFAKTRPGKLNYASGGVGGAPHLAGELFKSMAGINLVHVPYRGAGLFVADLVSGQVEMTFTNAVTALPFTSSGRLHGLAATGTTRMDVYPNLPTMAEAGLPGYEFTQWYALLAPAKTSSDIVVTLNGAIRKTLEDPEVRRRLASEGGVPSPTSPSELTEFIRAEIAKYEKIAKAAQLKMDQ